MNTKHSQQKCLLAGSFWLLSEKIFLPCNQMFDKDLQSRNEVSPGTSPASSSVQLYFLSGETVIQIPA